MREAGRHGMKKEEFKSWLLARGLGDHRAQSEVSRARRVETSLAALGIEQGSLEEAFEADEFAALLSAIDNAASALPDRVPPETLVPRSENYPERLQKVRRVVQLYGEFLGEVNTPTSAADRVRHHALENFIRPARAAGRSAVTISARQVNEELGLNNHYKNICQALSGKKLQQLADVDAPRLEGPNDSPNSVFHFDLADADDWAERELRKRYGSPIADTLKMISFATADQRQLALQRDVAGHQIWFEAGSVPPPVGDCRDYSPHEPRHSNLPPRLKKGPSSSDRQRRVVRVKFETPGELRSLLDWYGNRTELIDKEALERLRDLFLSKHPNFRTFTDSGSFAEAEDNYKRALVAEAASLMAGSQQLQPWQLGDQFLSLVAGKTSLESNLLDWRTARLVQSIRDDRPGDMEFAVSKLIKSEDPVTGVAEFAEAMWPYLEEKAETRPFAESRTIPTMIRALIEPDKMLGVRSKPTDNAAHMLLGSWAFGQNPLQEAEVKRVLSMAEQILIVMRDEWSWAPRDYWDVQGFIWETCQKRLSADTTDETEFEDSEPAMIEPTNLILYGPPGTGKTYQTAREAVALCGEDVPEDRDELMKLYRSLRQKGRIGFVTFHQSFSYEDFVEGLRPISEESCEDGGASSGFSLQPQDGIFKQIAELAATNRGKALPQEERLIEQDKGIFKMSLGRAKASEDEYIYQDALRDGYVVLGWGGSIDWSDPEYSDWEAIAKRWREDHPDASSNDPNITQTYTLRNDMEIGSTVVISDGNRKFRAIGKITGPYEFVPGRNGEYNHRRSVKWLWHTEDSLPRERIYGKELSQVSAYRMVSRQVNWEALEQIVSSSGEAARTTGTPEAHVLIIDEINRANISKVFGELITLLEPDKRLGKTNALTVELPYSKTEFGVPANLHLIGTMNTADRSIALLDTALRRRFKFEEVAPQPELLSEAQEASGLPLIALLSAINDRIEYLVDREHRIGHAFFMGCRDRDGVDQAMRDKVIPLLQEYFFDDWSRIKAVLGSGFIGERSLAPPPGIDGIETKSWFVRNEFALDAYDKLIAGDAPPQAVEDPRDPEGRE